MNAHIAQVNIGLPRAPLDSELLADFRAALEPINALAERSPGFVWRLQTADGDATGVRGFGDDRILINLTVWESIEALAEFVYRGAHAQIMRGRHRWFEILPNYMALWWVPAGHIPSVAEAEERCAHLRLHGPTPTAFTFKVSFPADAAGLLPADRRGGRFPSQMDHDASRWGCPV